MKKYSEDKEEFGHIWRIIYNIKTNWRCSELQITDVRIRKIAADGKMRAIVSITIDNEFVVHDIKIIEGLNGLFIAMPSRKTPAGDFRDIAHPINTDTRERIQTSILEAYEKVKSEEPKIKEAKVEEPAEETKIEETSEDVI